PVTAGELELVAATVADVDGVLPAMVCWSGLLADEAPDPIEPGTELDVIELPGPDGSYPPDTPVVCGGTRFVLGDLAELTPAAEVEPGLRAVLDDWLAN